MSVQDIDKLLSEFNQQATDIKNFLISIIDIVSDGRIPSKEDIKAFDAGMGSLGRKYKEIYQYAKVEVGEDEMPSYGSNVAKYADAVKSSNARLIKKQTANARQVITKFISIKSMLSEYEDALKPYQDAADELLDQIDESVIETITPKIDALKAFLSAMESETINGPDGIKLLELVSKHYPVRVQWGLAGKQYYYDTTEKEKPVEVKTIITDSVSEKEKMAPDMLPTNDEMEDVVEKYLDFLEENAISNKEDDIITAVFADEDTKKENNTRSTGQEKIAESITSKSDVLQVVNKVKKGTPNASSFKKEIVKLTKINKGIRVVLPLLTNLGILTKEQIYLFGVCMDCFEESDKSKNSIDSAIEALVSRGYLSCFEIQLDGQMTTAYCLSAYCSNCMYKDSIVRMKGFWGISFGDYKFVYDSEAKRSDVEEAVEANKLLLRYVYAMKDSMDKEEYQTIKHSIKWKNGHYQISVIIEGKVFNSYLIGPHVDISTVEENNLLLCEDKDVKCIAFNDKCERLFVFQQGDVLQYKLDNGMMVTVNPDEIELKENDIVGNIENADNPDTQVELNSGLESVSAFKQEESSENIEAAEQTKEILLVDVSPEGLLKKKTIPSDNEFCAVVLDILNRSATTKDQLTAVITQAVLLAKGAGIENNRPKAKKLSVQLSLATNLLLGEAAYTSENLSSSFINPEAENKPMMLAAYLFAMLAPSMAFDYGLKNQTDIFFENYEKYFGELSAFKPLFNKMKSVRDAAALGFSPAAIALLGSDEASRAFLADLVTMAKKCLIVQAPKTRMKALPVLYNTCFGTGSDLHECMQLIADDKKDSDSVEFIEEILSEYCNKQNDIFMISMDKIENRLNAEWSKINSRNKFKLEYDARDQALRQFIVRIEVMLPWAEHINNSNKKKQDISRLRVLKKELLDLIRDIQKDNSWKKIQDANILSWMLQYMKVYLNGRSSKLKVYSELLLTGVIGLKDDGTPNIDETMAEIRFYEPWRNALRHIVAKKASVTDVKSEILGENLEADDEAGLKDNLHQLEMLGRLLDSTDEDYIITAGQLREAAESADERTMRFKGTLELAYTYNQINETEKETIAGIMAKYKGSFYEANDFACWRRFLEALEEQIKEFAAGRKKMLRAELDSRLQKDEKSAESSLLKEADRLLEEDMNFAVAEEYINRFDLDETELDDELDFVLHERNYFEDFLTKSTFDRLLRECKRNKGLALKSFGWKYLEKNLPKEWTSRQKEDSQKMILSWPSSKDVTAPAQIQMLFSCLGFKVDQAFKMYGRKEEMFQIVVTPTARSMADYRHPIAAFGTQVKSPINVIILYGNYTEKQLVDTISSLDLGGIAVVLIDRPIEAAGRRLIGEIFHTQTSGQNPFLLIDQVLFLYLAMHQETERLPALLKCTLPYTTYQPFVRDGGSTADEMFCGRTQELATIIDPNGACVVYGGRQLGKTALLERAESRCSKPRNKKYAVYTSIIRISSEEEVVSTLISDIDKKTDGKIQLKPCKTLKEMCEQLSKMFGRKQIVSMHLLIDEVDDFLTAIANQKYIPIQPLVDLRRETKNNFKFVIAGLHNVCRAKNATRQNGIFGQLGTPLCIKPLSPTDALKLLSRPLNYLGFQIDRYPHLETILTNTNYYPGILQFFGYMLVETLTGQYAKYYSATSGNPPFTLQDEQLGAVMNSSDLHKSIKDKFRWSLELDSRYFMIARCIRMLYYFFEEDRSSGSWLGFRVDEIMDMARSYKIKCLKNESMNGFINLLDEMVEMGILSRPKIDLYRLRRSSFMDIIGENIDTLEADIINNNEEA